MGKKHLTRANLSISDFLRHQDVEIFEVGPSLGMNDSAGAAIRLGITAVLLNKMSNKVTGQINNKSTDENDQEVTDGSNNERHGYRGGTKKSFRHKLTS